MIRLTKAEKPEILVRNETGWRDEYQRHRAGGEVPSAAATRYRHPHIKRAALEESFGKCIYCESKPSHVHPGDLEHIRPKSLHPHLVVEWTNLGFVCNECNRRKGSYDHHTLLLVNPFTEDPDDFLLFAGPLVFQRPGSQRGLATISIIKLNREQLTGRRIERLEALQRLIDQWAQLPEGQLKNALLTELLAEAEKNREYSAAAKALLRAQELA